LFAKLKKKFYGAHQKNWLAV